MVMLFSLKTNVAVLSYTAFVSLITALILVYFPNFFILLSPKQRSKKEITPKQKTEEALKKSEERWELVLQSTGDGIFDWNIVTGEAFMSASLKASLGYTEGEIANNFEAWQNLVHPEDIDSVKTSIQTHLEKKTPKYIAEYRLRCQDGSYQWNLARGQAQWNEEGKPVRMVGSHQDISKRKQAEAKVTQLNRELEQRVLDRTKELETANSALNQGLEREQTARKETEIAKGEIELYQDIVENISIGFCVWSLEDLTDPSSLRLVTANPAASKLLALELKNDFGKTIGECFPNTLTAPHQTNIEAYAEVVLSGQPKFFNELHYGDERIKAAIYSVRAFPLSNNCVGIAFEDITIRKQAETELKTRAGELEKLNTVLLTTTAQLEKRNQELDQFTYVISHDLKAPLRAISNLSEWIEEDIEDKLDEDTKHQMNLLRSRVQRMRSLIDGLLQYSRVGRVRDEGEEVSVEILLEEIIDSLAPPEEFTIEVAVKMPPFTTERIPLQQVLTNLISNAIKHHNRPDGKVKISVREQGDFYRFAISDDGLGIDPKYQEKVFAIFQTLEAKDKTENTGIGLSIVKKIVENVGGKIEIESQLGQGSTFYFTWPKSIEI